MNRHERRAAAAHSRRAGGVASSRRKEDPVMMVSQNSPIAMDIKSDIARCVRAIDWPFAAQDCLTRAALGKWTLGLLGFEADWTAGSLLYRAGPDPFRDVCAFHGPNNTGVVHPDGYLLGHIWLEMDGEIIDFTSGDWNSIRADEADIEETGFGDIVWVKPPPEFVWANKTLFDWKSVGAPPLGKCWYGPFEGEYAIVPDAHAAEVIAASEMTMRENLTRMNLFERCKRLRN